MADKKKILFIVETMGGGVFNDVADLHHSYTSVLEVTT